MFYIISILCATLTIIQSVQSMNNIAPEINVELLDNIDPFLRRCESFPISSIKYHTGIKRAASSPHTIQILTPHSPIGSSSEDMTASPNRSYGPTPYSYNSDPLSSPVNDQPSFLDIIRSANYKLFKLCQNKKMSAYYKTHAGIDLLEQGADPNFTCNHANLLQTAIMHTNLEMVRLLIAYNATINQDIIELARSRQKIIDGQNELPVILRLLNRRKPYDSRHYPLYKKFHKTFERNKRILSKDAHDISQIIEELELHHNSAIRDK